MFTFKSHSILPTKTQLDENQEDLVYAETNEQLYTGLHLHENRGCRITYPKTYIQTAHLFFPPLKNIHAKLVKQVLRMITKRVHFLGWSYSPQESLTVTSTIYSQCTTNFNLQILNMFSIYDSTSRSVGNKDATSVRVINTVLENPPYLFGSEVILEKSRQV